MKLWVLATLTVLIYFTAAYSSKSSWGLENEALMVRCPRQERSRYPVDWYYSKSNKTITTQKGNRVFASGERLKLLPAKVEDSGIYTCIIRSPTFNKTGYVNVTIYKKQPDCNIPDYLMYSTISGSEKNSRIDCPTIDLYNWTGPVEWFKNCKPLQGSRYYMQATYLLIDSATSKDVGDYTCKFMHNENGASYSVTATRSFMVQDEKGFSLNPEIIAPSQNETKEVEIGKTANITCSACFGKGTQLLAAVLWLVNGSKAGNRSQARIWEEQEQTVSPGSQLTCLSTVLRIAPVTEGDLRRKFECLALNFRGLRKHTLWLRRAKPIDRQSTYYVVAGFVILLMLISIMMITLKVFWIEFVLLWRDIARPHKARNDGKTYDAYVIYPRNHKDSPEMICSVEYFVHQILPDVLENKCGYKLCIYGRDMLPGEDVATAVETKIRKSRRHIFILTPQAVHSEECAYEQEVALHSALVHNDSKAILIEMEAQSEPRPLQLSGLPGSLQHLVQVQGTIRWREDHVADKRALNSRFWKRVRYHMPAPSTLRRETSGSAASTAQGQ